MSVYHCSTGFRKPQLDRIKGLASIPQQQGLISAGLMKAVVLACQPIIWALQKPALLF